MKTNDTYCAPDKIAPHRETWPIPLASQTFPTDAPQRRELSTDTASLPSRNPGPDMDGQGEFDGASLLPSRDQVPPIDGQRASAEQDADPSADLPSLPTTSGERAGESGSNTEFPADSSEIQNNHAKALLRQLSHEQIQQLYQWLYQYSAPRVTAFVAEHFGIKTHATTLKRIRARLRADDTVDLLEAGGDHVDLVMREVGPTPYLPLIKQLLQRQALYMAQHNAASHDIQPLLMAIARFAELDHKRQHLAYLRARDGQTQNQSNPH